MHFTPSLVFQTVWSVVLIILTVLITQFLDRRSRLLVYYGSVGAFQLPPPTAGGPPLGVNTHTVVIRNAGRLAATNIRVPHAGGLEEANIHVSVFPPTTTKREEVDGRVVIVIPTLPPRMQVTLSYLYFPPITFNAINLLISSDEGAARVLNVLPTPQPPRWLRVILWLLIVVGAAAILYGAFELLRHVLPGLAGTP